MKKYNEVEITIDDLKKIVYFILIKFRGDSHHRQGTSSKRDLIGGYIDRWFNKVAETVIFNDLLKDKSYKVVSDYFLYGNDSEKNAPDILGIKKASSEHIPFSKFENGTWVVTSGMPRIEVKVVRQDQALLGVREPQMIDDYYVFIESKLEGDYLTAIFEDEVFEDKYIQEIEMSDEFILKDENTQILPHYKMRKSEKIGTMRLIGTYTKDELRSNTTLCVKNVSPIYFSSATNANRVVKPQSEVDYLTIDKDGKVNLGVGNDSEVYLPFSINAVNGGVNRLKILKRNKGSLYLESDRVLFVDGYKTQPGIVKIEFKTFERSSSWDENVCSKFMLEKYGKDSTQQLISLFDEIYKT